MAHTLIFVYGPSREQPHGAPDLLHAKYGLDVDGIFEKIKSFAHEFPVRPKLRFRSLLRSYFGIGPAEEGGRRRFEDSSVPSCRRYLAAGGASCGRIHRMENEAALSALEHFWFKCLRIRMRPSSSSIPPG